MRARRHLVLFLRWTVVACLVAAWAPARVAAVAVAVDPDQPSATERVPASAWPCRLVITKELRPIVQLAWAQSPTFRSQCARLAQSGTIVFVHLIASVQIRRQAQSVIGVTEDGATVARVLVRSSADTVEAIAHEFEHVLEYLEGVDHRRSGTMLSHDAYETDRAMDAGTRVAREVRDSWPTKR
jgi:hypothetical protein